MDPQNAEAKPITTRPLELGELAQRAALTPRVVDIVSPDGVPGQFAVVPTVEATGRTWVKLESVDRFCNENRDKPRRRMGTANLGDIASLIAHVNRFKDADSAIFANTDREQPSIIAVLDYHRQGSAGAPRFGQHRSRYAFPVSDEWKAWTEVDGKDMDQEAFARFIETRLVDAVDPSVAGDTAKTFADKCGVAFAQPAKLLELSHGLAITVGVKLANTVNLTSGEKQIVFSEEHADKDGAPLKVPSAFLIGIPVFRADARYQVCVRLRYRKQSGFLVWCMDLYRHEEVFDHAILQACEAVKKETGLPLLVGTPE